MHLRVNGHRGDKSLWGAKLSVAKFYGRLRNSGKAEGVNIMGMMASSSRCWFTPALAHAWRNSRRQTCETGCCVKGTALVGGSKEGSVWPLPHQDVTYQP